MQSLVGKVQEERLGGVLLLPDELHGLLGVEVGAVQPTGPELHLLVPPQLHHIARKAIKLERGEGRSLTAAGTGSPQSVSEGERVKLEWKIIDRAPFLID